MSERDSARKDFRSPTPEAPGCLRRGVHVRKPPKEKLFTVCLRVLPFFLSNSTRILSFLLFTRIKSVKVKNAEKTVTVALRLPRSTYGALVECSKEEGKSISDLMRSLVYREFSLTYEESEREKTLKLIQKQVRDLGSDLETVVRLLMVALKISSDEEAKDWCRKNLSVRGGRETCSP